ncbi:hypothetical protein PR202_gb00168 [Eleusine coracana subsp. coracana]|uniref:Uncharacterized protein n=1 Tax=Eleusine coracana subsp. coracana TaxID=191504 RepID=A0AAV5DTI1_ELECO|nr:hypothetical protein PR202_gb00168 [Eleusine coracana subsp. coracana]
MEMDAHGKGMWGLGSRLELKATDPAPPPQRGFLFSPFRVPVDGIGSFLCYLESPQNDCGVGRPPPLFSLLQRRSARRPQPAPGSNRSELALLLPEATPRLPNARAPGAKAEQREEKWSGEAWLSTIHPVRICLGARAGGWRSRGAGPASCVGGRTEAPLRAAGGGMRVAIVPLDLDEF